MIDQCTGMEDENADEEEKENRKLVRGVRFFGLRRMESIRREENQRMLCCELWFRGARYLFIYASWRSRKGPRMGPPVVLRAVRHSELNPHDFGVGCNRTLSVDGRSGGHPW